jgi:hypothetical protein
MLYFQKKKDKWLMDELVLREKDERVAFDGRFW